MRLVRQSVFMMSFCLCLGGLTGCHRRDCVQEEVRLSNARRAFVAQRHSTLRPCSSEEMAKMERLFDAATIAYTNGAREQFSFLLPRMTNLVGRIGWKNYGRLTVAFDRAVDDAFLCCPDGRTFSSCAEFADFLDLNVAAVRFHAELELSREGCEITAADREGTMLRRLLACRDYYGTHGNVEFAKAVERRIADWKQQIESERGIAHRAARRQFALSQAYRAEVGDLTLRQVYNSARAHAQSLITAGYTPQWLEKEFPLPQGDQK